MDLLAHLLHRDTRLGEDLPHRLGVHSFVNTDLTLGAHFPAGQAEFPLQQRRSLLGQVRAQVQIVGAFLFQLSGGDLLHHAALLDNAVPGGDLAQFPQDMRADQNGQSPLSIQVQKQLPHFPDALRVQTVDGLVQQQQVRPAQQGQADAQPLFHTHGVVLHRLFFRCGKAHGVQDLIHLPPGAVQPQQSGIQEEIFPSAQIRIQSRLLDESPHPAAGRRVPDGPAEDLRLSLSGPGQPAQEFQGCGFARAILANEAVDVSLLHLQVQVVYRPFVPVPLGQPHCLYYCHTKASFFVCRLSLTDECPNIAKKR